MDKITQVSLLLNLIILFFTFLPTAIFIYQKKSLSSKRNLIITILTTLIFNSFLSIFINKMSYNIFSFFTNTSGIINLAIYMSKIIFITLPFFSIKYILSTYFLKNNQKKLAVTLTVSKLTTNLILFFIGINFISLNFALYSFPIVDFIFLIIYILSYLKIFR